MNSSLVAIRILVFWRILLSFVLASARPTWFSFDCCAMRHVWPRFIMRWQMPENFSRVDLKIFIKFGMPEGEISYHWISKNGYWVTLPVVARFYVIYCQFFPLFSWLGEKFEVWLLARKFFLEIASTTQTGKHIQHVQHPPIRAIFVLIWTPIFSIQLYEYLEHTVLKKFSSVFEVSFFFCFLQACLQVCLLVVGQLGNLHTVPVLVRFFKNFEPRLYHNIYIINYNRKWMLSEVLLRW